MSMCVQGCGREAAYPRVGLCAPCYLRDFRRYGGIVERRNSERRSGEQAWKADAACRGMGPDLFFSDEWHDRERAKAVCASCPVREPCGEFGIGEADGIWSGAPAESLRRRRRAQSA